MKNTFSLAIFLLWAGALVESPLYAADRAVPDTPGERVNVDQECADVANLRPPTTDMPSKKFWMTYPDAKRMSFIMILKVIPRRHRKAGTR